MDTNRNDFSLPGALDDAVFASFGEDDSIVDRLLSMPAGDDSGSASRVWNTAIAKRAEKLIADRMRKKIGDDAA